MKPKNIPGLINDDSSIDNSVRMSILRANRKTLNPLQNHPSRVVPTKDPISGKVYLVMWSHDDGAYRFNRATY